MVLHFLILVKDDEMAKDARSQKTAENAFAMLMSG